MHVMLLSALLLQVATPDSTTLRGVRSPTYAPDGRLAFAVDGDVFEVSDGCRNRILIKMRTPTD